MTVLSWFVGRKRLLFYVGVECTDGDDGERFVAGPMHDVWLHGE